MPERPGELSGDLTAAEAQGVLAQLDEARQRRAEAARQQQLARASEALSLRTAGLSNAQIADRLQISPSGVADMITRALMRKRPNAHLEELRELENGRLDRAQAAIWSKVLEGDTKAIDTFLRINFARRRLNGLDAPLDIRLSVTVRQEMEAALAQLEQVLHQVIPGEVISSREHDDGDARRA